MNEFWTELLIYGEILESRCYVGRTVETQGDYTSCRDLQTPLSRQIPARPAIKGKL